MLKEPSQAGTESLPPEGIVDVRDWLTYYSECLKYELVMGQKFTTLLGQASLFSFTASAAIFTLAEKLNVRWPTNLWIAVLSMLGLFMYAVLADRYFLQIRRTGTLILDLEDRLRLGSYGLLHALRSSPGVFYGRPWALVLVRVYLIALVVLPFAAIKVAS